MDSYRKLVTALFATCALLTLAFAASAQANHVSPSILDDPSTEQPATKNVTCAEIDPSYRELKFEPVSNGTKTSSDGFLKVTLSGTNGTTFDWTALVGSVDLVLVKGGNYTNAYAYDPEGTADTDLHSPDQDGDNDGSFAGLSHVSFCYDLEQRISGVKYHDLNADGDQDEGEDVISGNDQPFTFYLDLNLSGGWNAGEPTDTSDALGAYSFDVEPGTYSVREIDDPTDSWYCSTALGACNYSVTVGLGQSSSGNDFGNYEKVSLSGCKYEDLDGDGGLDEAWSHDPVTITLSPTDDSTSTDEDGCYEFTDLMPGVAYSVSETVPGSAACTAPADDCSTTFAEAESGDSFSQDFANFIPDPGITISKVLTDEEADSVVHVGEQIDYTIVVKNTGNTLLHVELSDVIKDSDPAIAGCDLGDADTSFDLAANDDTEGGTDEATFTCSAEAPDADSYTNQACVVASDDYDNTLGEDPEICDDVTTRIIHPSISVTKAVDKAVAHEGDLLTYEIVVTNTGDGPLTVSMTDVEKGTQVAGCTFTEQVPESFELAAAGDEGGADSRTFECTKDAPEGQSSYVNEVCVEAMDELDSAVPGDCAEAKTDIIKPDIDVTKSVDKAQARVGETLTYAIVVSNPSDTDLVKVDMTDLEKGTAAAGCEFPAGTSMTFELEAGGSKQFTCTKSMPDQDAYVNEVCVSGEDMLGGPKGTVGPECAEAQTTILRDPAPPAEPVVEPPPGQVVLGERIAPGAARLLGPTGCRGTAFRVRVNGTKVARVVFTLDGKRLQTLTKPNFRGQFAVRINPRRMKVGVHRLRAVVTFERGSGTRPKTMRLSFQRCGRALQAPRFTG